MGEPDEPGYIPALSDFDSLHNLRLHFFVLLFVFFVLIPLLLVQVSQLYQIKKKGRPVYKKRYTIGQFTIMPTVPNGLPPNPVNHPFSTNPKIVNSSSILDRYPLSIAFWVHCPMLRSHSGL